MNLLIITADDMSYNSTGMSGCEFKNITPTIDQLSRSGLFFTNAHTNIGLCKPARTVLMTGKYPWNNGNNGSNGKIIEPINETTITLPELLKGIGYHTGVIGKIVHVSDKKLIWDECPEMTGWSHWSKESKGKDKNVYYDWCKSFLHRTKEPFFLMVNSHYPHRYYPDETRYDPNLVVVPKILPDTLEVRKDIARYYEAVTRCDEIVESILCCLEKSGKIKDTLIVFTSDHGMSFPFIKASCYHFSTKIPLTIYQEGIKHHICNDLISGIDIMPTILEMLKIQCPPVDGSPWKSSTNNIYSCLIQNYGGTSYQTRAIHDCKFCYVRNFWSDGNTKFVEDGALDSQPCVDALRIHSPDLYHKLKYRSSEELYDISHNPFDCKITNEEKLSEYRKKLKEMAIKSKDYYTIRSFRSEIKHY